MLIGRFQPSGEEPYLGAILEDGILNLTAIEPDVFGSVASWLQQPDPVEAALGAWRLALGEGKDVRLSTTQLRWVPGAESGALRAPIDRQEVWAAGVTYLRSKEARMEESEGGGSFYDRVYAAERPELFLKATPSRVAGPNEPIRIRGDAAWNVPEPEVALVISAGRGPSAEWVGPPPPRPAQSLRIVGYTVGNDVSSRDIEGENPLYLPQAKVYRQCCALGPVILLEEEARGHRNFDVRLAIERRGETVFHGETSTAQMKRRFDELVEYLGRDNLFPDGAFLLTGTGIVPPDDFTLQAGDVVVIDVPGIGTLRNPVIQGGKA